MIRPQTAQFLLKDLFDTVHALDQIVGQLCGNIDLAPQLAFFQNLTDGGFASGIDIGRIKIVDSFIDCRSDQCFGLFQIDSAVLARKTHTTQTQNGKRISIFIVSVIHMLHPLVSRSDASI